MVKINIETVRKALHKNLQRYNPSLTLTEVTDCGELSFCIERTLEEKSWGIDPNHQDLEDACQSVMWRFECEWDDSLTNWLQDPPYDESNTDEVWPCSLCGAPITETCGCETLLPEDPLTDAPF